MKVSNWHKLAVAAVFTGASLVTSQALAVTTNTSFQTGINGYSSLFDRKIDERGGTNDQQGAEVTQYSLDGYDGAGSPDAQLLMRYDNIIGNGPGQIPPNATILSANLQLSTSTSGNAQSAGPWGIGQLLQPFDATTTYFGTFNCGGCALISRGAWFEDGYSKRPIAGYGSNWQGEVTTNDVRSIVQNWVNGEANHGMVIQTGNPAGTADGWGLLSSGHPLPERRPKLSVTYTTDTVTKQTFQHDLNGYTGDTMAYVRSGTNIVGTTTEADSKKDDITHNGLTGDFTVAANTTIATPAPLASFQQFLDGPQFESPTGVANSVDDFALIKFGNVFGAGANQSPANVPVAKAYLSLTTGTSSTAAMSNGEWAVHRMLRDWNTTTLHSEIGSLPGLQVADGDITAPLDIQSGMIFGSEVWFDVTSYLEGVRSGAADFGLAIQSLATADGWQIHLNGSTDADLRPKLHVISGQVSIVTPGLVGDFNGDEIVDAADYTTWRDHLGGAHNLNGNGDETGGSAGIVDQADYNLWKSSFGNVGSGLGGAATAAVPEPTTCWLFAVGLVGLVVTSHRK
jgi:hypothetical protein